MEKEFVKSLAYNLNLSPSGSRGSAVNYATRPFVIVQFTDEDFNEKVDSASLLSLPRRTDRALLFAAQLLRNFGRKKHKIAILLTGGNEVPGSAPLQEAVQPLRDLEAQLYVVVIGDQPDTRRLASDVTNSRNIFRVQSYNNLFAQGGPIATHIRDTYSKCDSALQT